MAAILFLSTLAAQGQDLNITQGWKFKTGDDAKWSYPNLNDSDWAPIQVGKPWEVQGYANYDGFGWYRLHIIIPSSIKEKSFLKEQIRFDLGKIDDGDDVYLNGSLIGRNAGKSSDIKAGQWDVQRSYVLSIRDKRILWDKENVIAVRVWDHGGGGGMYAGNYGISILDVTDYILIDNGEYPFEFLPGNKISKKIELKSLSDQFDFTGKLRINVIDATTGAVAYKQTIGVDFAKNRPFEYNVNAQLPEVKSYQVVYTFTEDRTKKEIEVREGIPYILTPKARSSPAIHGASVFGCRVGSPFLYRIAASGDKPMSYEAVGLPGGLKLDKQSGIISGTLSGNGNFKIKLSAKNKNGEANKTLEIICGDNICLTPALGWNSWNCWGLSVNDEKIRKSAAVMLDKLADHGWSYINIDDGWEDKRNEKGEVVPNQKFPDMKSLGEYVHSLGLKLGIYSSPGTLTCGGFLGSYQHEDQDAATYAKWGIDYLKYDWCSYNQIAPANPSLEDMKKPYLVMRGSLNNCKRDIVFSLCQYGMGDVWNWGAEVGGNSWRTTGDIVDTWESLSGIGFTQGLAAQKTSPGHFNDPDMLIVGKLGWGPSLHNTRLTPDEQYTHISLWCLLSAPLLIGCDMSQLDDFTLNLLTNDEVMAVDQDAMAKPAQKVFSKDNIQIWTKALQDGTRAIGIFNLSDQANKQEIHFSDIQAGKKVSLRDLWRQKDLGVHTDKFSAELPPHGVLLLKVRNVQ